MVPVSCKLLCANAISKFKVTQGNVFLLSVVIYSSTAVDAYSTAKGVWNPFKYAPVIWT